MFLSNNFLGIPEAENTLEKSRVVVLPVPYERTVSYGVGTRNGPGAILEASRYVELYDDELDEEVFRVGIHTLPPWLPDRMEPEACVEALAGVVSELLAKPRFVLTLGGEHAIATGPIRAHHSRYPGLSILHFDAHGDLRDEYEGDRHSHACAARRFLETGLPSVHVGIRSISREEVDFAKRQGLLIVSNRRLPNVDGWMPEALAPSSRAPARPSPAAAPGSRPWRSCGGSRRRRPSSAPTSSSTPRCRETGRPISWSPSSATSCSAIPSSPGRSLARTPEAAKSL